MRTQSHKYVDAFNKAFISHDIEHCINVIETVKLQKNGKELSDTLDEIIQIVVERIEINPGNLSQTIKLLPSLHSLKNSNYLLRILHCVQRNLLNFVDIMSLNSEKVCARNLSDIWKFLIENELKNEAEEFCEYLLTVSEWELKNGNDPNLCSEEIVGILLETSVENKFQSTVQHVLEIMQLSDFILPKPTLSAIKALDFAKRREDAVPLIYQSLAARKEIFIFEDRVAFILECFSYLIPTDEEFEKWHKIACEALVELKSTGEISKLIHFLYKPPVSKFNHLWTWRTSVFLYEHANHDDYPWDSRKGNCNYLLWLIKNNLIEEAKFFVLRYEDTVQQSNWILLLAKELAKKGDVKNSLLVTEFVFPPDDRSIVYSEIATWFGNNDMLEDSLEWQKRINTDTLRIEPIIAHILSYIKQPNLCDRVQLEEYLNELAHLSSHIRKKSHFGGVKWLNEVVIDGYMKMFVLFFDHQWQKESQFVLDGLLQLCNDYSYSATKIQKELSWRLFHRDTPFDTFLRKARYFEITNDLLYDFSRLKLFSKFSKKVVNLKTDKGRSNYLIKLKNHIQENPRQGHNQIKPGDEINLQF